MMHPQAFLDDVGDRHARRERAVGVLEHDLHVAAERPHLPERQARRSCLPRNTIGPSDEISRRIASPSVVLPEPDSPTTPSVSPWRTAMLDAVDRLDVADRPAQHAALDREPDLEVLGLDHDRRVGCDRRRIGLRLGGEQRAGIGMLAAR